MKNIFIYAFVIFFLNTGCRKEIARKEVKSNLTKSDTITKFSAPKNELDCGDIIYQLVKSSDLNLKDYNDNYFVRVESIKNDSINIKVYVENNLSDDPKYKEMVESTIAWLLFLPNEKKLWNVTVDPEHPTRVKFNFNDFAAIYGLCNITQKGLNDDDSQVGENIKDQDCKTITVEMGKGEECILKNTTIEKVYANIIKNGEVDDYKYLLKLIPKNDKTIEINKDGLMSIEYKVQKNKIEISFSYSGGVTEVNLEKVDNDIKRSIIYYAD